MDDRVVILLGGGTKKTPATGHRESAGMLGRVQTKKEAGELKHASDPRF
jgi:hypothetical protein